jgi:hypothetical protein
MCRMLVRGVRRAGLTSSRLPSKVAEPGRKGCLSDGLFASLPDAYSGTYVGVVRSTKGDESTDHI